MATAVRGETVTTRNLFGNLTTVFLAVYGIAGLRLAVLSPEDDGRDGHDDDHGGGEEIPDDRARVETIREFQDVVVKIDDRYVSGEHEEQVGRQRVSFRTRLVGLDAGANVEVNDQGQDDQGHRVDHVIPKWLHAVGAQREVGVEEEQGDGIKHAEYGNKSE